MDRKGCCWDVAKTKGNRSQFCVPFLTHSNAAAIQELFIFIFTNL
jgi:hypothetical protein